jgi:hypothetical protein
MKHTHLCVALHSNAREVHKTSETSVYRRTPYRNENSYRHSLCCVCVIGVRTTRAWSCTRSCCCCWHAVATVCKTYRRTYTTHLRSRPVCGEQQLEGEHDTSVDDRSRVLFDSARANGSERWEHEGTEYSPMVIAPRHAPLVQLQMANKFDAVCQPPGRAFVPNNARWPSPRAAPVEQRLAADRPHPVGCCRGAPHRARHQTKQARWL